MKKLILPIILIFLFCTVRIHAQNTQVSPVAGLNQQNTSVVNNNFQIAQTGINGIFNLFSQYFTGGILNTASGGTGQNSSNWTAGDLIYMSGTGKWGHTSPSRISIFTSSGTFVASTTTVYLTMVGGGGGGASNGAGGSNNASGGGGTGGEYLINYPYTTVIGNSYTVTINSGGTGGTSVTTGNNGHAGSNGGSVVFDLITVPGGTGGAANIGVAQGIATTAPGSLNASTTTGGGSALPSGNGGAAAIRFGGGGGSSPFGTGGSGITDSTGGAGNGFGAGGAGGGTVNGNNNASNAGANGSPGFLIITD